LNIEIITPKNERVFNGPESYGVVGKQMRKTPPCHFERRMAVDGHGGVENLLAVSDLGRS